MSIQWTLIAALLYLEVAVIILMTLPIITVQTWNVFFNSSLFQFLQQRSRLRNWFIVQSGTLSIFLLDSVREMMKYTTDVDADRLENMRLFRAERNFYIAGFALFLSVVIRRLAFLISLQAYLLTKLEELTGLKSRVEELEGNLRGAVSENAQALKDQAQSITAGLGNEYSKFHKKLIATTSSHSGHSANVQ